MKGPSNSIRESVEVRSPLRPLIHKKNSIQFNSMREQCAHRHKYFTFLYPHLCPPRPDAGAPFPVVRESAGTGTWVPVAVPVPGRLFEGSVEVGTHSHDPGSTKSTGGMRKAASRSSATAPRQSVNDQLISLRCGTPGRRRCQRSLSRASSLRGSAVRRPRLLSRWPSGVQKTRGAPRGGAWRCPCRASSG